MCLKNIGPKLTTLPYILDIIDIYDVLTQNQKFFSFFQNPLHTETLEFIFVISLGLDKINL